MTTPRLPRVRATVLAAILIASTAAVSAHVVRGLISPTEATAFVSSPTPAGDAPVALKWMSTNANGTVTVVDTHIRAACFNVANTSPARVDSPEWPRVTSVGLELPDSPSGFSLIEPVGGDWTLVEGTRAFLPGHGFVTLAFTIVARSDLAVPWWKSPSELPGIPPGQAATRGAGTRFCVSGPFPDVLPNIRTEDPEDTAPTTIEDLINGVVVGFRGVNGNPAGFDAGVWDNTLRRIPLYRSSE
jgi:hypothetical protein